MGKKQANVFLPLISCKSNDAKLMYDFMILVMPRTPIHTSIIRDSNFWKLYEHVLLKYKNT